MATALELADSPYLDLQKKIYRKFAMPSENPESSPFVNCMSLTQIIFTRRTGIYLPPEDFYSQNLFNNIYEFENIDLYDAKYGDIALLGPEGVTDFASLHQATFHTFPMDGESALIHARGRGPIKGVVLESLSEIQSNPYYRKIYAIKRESRIIYSL